MSIQCRFRTSEAHSNGSESMRRTIISRRTLLVAVPRCQRVFDLEILSAIFSFVHDGLGDSTLPSADQGFHCLGAVHRCAWTESKTGLQVRTCTLFVQERCLLTEGPAIPVFPLRQMECSRLGTMRPYQRSTCPPRHPSAATKDSDAA